MVERVARALCTLDGHPENAKMDGKPLWASYLPEARAVLDAMRDPTKSMLEAGGMNERWDGAMRSTSEDEAAALLTWQTMIHAALAEED